MQYENGRDEIAAKWAKLAASFKGPMAPMVVLTLAFAATVIWLQKSFTDTIAKMDEKRAAEHQAIVESMDTFGWIISLPQDRRPELMPPSSVWKRLKAQTYDELDRERTHPRKSNE
jgi:hypothetical protein